MKRRIALLSDVHGNATALEAVLADAESQAVTDYWFLGDLLMPGTGRRNILDKLERLPISLQVRGNWEDSLWHALHQKLDLTRPSHLYLTKLCHFVLEEILPEEIDRMRELPLQVLTEVAGLKIAVSHHLPDKNWGRELIHIGNQSDFDRLFEGNEAVIAIYGHIHQQFLRYGTGGQLIINPGSIGQPFFLDATLRQDLRAQYAILEIDETGLKDVDMRRVAYDVEHELARARELQLPYYEIYEESLVNGIHHTHNHDLLREISEREGYFEDVQDFIRNLD
ncbi:serine/threonine protein phosphatase family protein [Streptococcus cristatus]|uniref:Serine/threonine protein phosphatase family protein n=1 Tax=Streptococcus cristatus AS 1.3089 TaxID=1302863 RepID=A0ABN4B6N2_STRCR|nr:metallophosphoesterase family protein [Streptococcus cristatus]AGK71242.1 serine/threonine protein phosphatase family protein [Streptococcus cristatus AS 1.3089]SQI46259.1 serine/threonine protein phosphatase family protein [Streptococcus cristatus]